MDPTPAQQWRAGVDNSIARLDAGMTEIISMLRNLSVPSHTQTSPQPVGPPAVPEATTREPNLCPPEVFKGDADQCRAFLTQCEIHFELQPSSFPTDRSKVAYVISLLSGKAKQWGTAEWQNKSPCTFSYSVFAKELIRVFDPVLPAREAARGLLSLKQGSRSVTAYIIDFHLLAADSSWNNEALMDVFLQGLNEDIKDELATRDFPSSLKELEDLAARIDLRLSERRRERSYKGKQAVFTTQAKADTQLTAVSSPPTSEPEPMQLGRLRISAEERFRRKQQNLCFYCGGRGHRAIGCPLKEQAQ